MVLRLLRLHVTPLFILSLVKNILKRVFKIFLKYFLKYFIGCFCPSDFPCLAAMAETLLKYPWHSRKHPYNTHDSPIKHPTKHKSAFPMSQWWLSIRKPVLSIQLNRLFGVLEARKFLLVVVVGDGWWVVFLVFIDSLFCWVVF